MRWLALLALSPLAAAPAQEAAREERPYPTLVTAATRADAAEVARLQRPGEVLFVDRFEAEQALETYFEIRGRKEGRAVIDRTPGLAHGGEGALRLSAPANEGRESGSSAVRWLGDAGHDCLHLRYWIRYAEDYDQGNLNHTGGSLSGVAGTFKWAGMGQAGKRPAGDDRFSVRTEGWRSWGRTPAPGYLFCYAYWMDMRRDRDGNYWGNMMGPAEAERFVPRRGEWLCVEQRVRVNTPGEADGELAVWLDGELYLHYAGFRWRSSEEVRLKRMALMVYVHHASQQNVVWYDDVVVSTGYVGPGEVEAPAKKEADPGRQERGGAR